MKEKIKVIIKRPDEKLGHTFHIANKLETLQYIVKGEGQERGFIEAVHVSKNLIVICNEEGRLMNLPRNCVINDVPFCGTIILIGEDGEDFDDCPIDLDGFERMFKNGRARNLFL